MLWAKFFNIHVSRVKDNKIKWAIVDKVWQKRTTKIVTNRPSGKLKVKKFGFFPLNVFDFFSYF